MYSIHSIMTKVVFQILIVFFIFCSCKPKYENYESEKLKIEQISDKIFQHTSYLQTKTMGKIACNGMIYINENEAIVFDTPTNDKASEELINWLGKEKTKVVVVTHFHIDCLGGLQEFHSNGIKSYATNQTIKLAKEKGKKTIPQNGFKNSYQFKIGNESLLAKYFGAGHTKDNIIGYVPTEKTLFGGCLIKSLNAPKGNLADASISDWSKTVEKIKTELPEIKNVITGHGKNGGTELLDYTIEMFKE